MCLVKRAFGIVEGDRITREERLVEVDKRFTKQSINKIVISSKIDDQHIYEVKLLNKQYNHNKNKFFLWIYVCHYKTTEIV